MITETEPVALAMSGASGSCAACGQRVTEAQPCIYAPATGLTRYLYVLCPGCRTAVETDSPAKEAVLKAVEQRCAHGPGARA